MHDLYELKSMLMDEVKKIVQTGELTAGSLETVDKLLNSIKNACKIIMYDEYEKDGYSYSDGDRDMSTYAYARGRHTQRDNMGRYSRRGGYSYADSSEKVAMLREMMGEVNSDDERRALQKLIRKMESE